jgi:hypothetical protein
LSKYLQTVPGAIRVWSARRARPTSASKTEAKSFPQRVARMLGMKDELFIDSDGDNLLIQLPPTKAFPEQN